MSDTITCRVCDARGPANPDAVLLCPRCRTQPTAALAHVERVLTMAEHHAERLLRDLSAADTGRYLALCQARRAARTAGAMAGFQRRYAATLAQGDALADVLTAMDALAETRAWAARARTEVDAMNEGVTV